MSFDCDVAIVGYGPVGQTLAILLGQRGWRVTVLEKQPAANQLPRGGPSHPRAATLLRRGGARPRRGGGAPTPPTSMSGGTPPVPYCCVSRARPPGSPAGRTPTCSRS